MGFGSFTNPTGPKAITVKLQSASQGREISPWIYGIGANMREGHNEKNVWSLHPSLVRWGGNTTERFNWKHNAWNTGSDWYFINTFSRFPNVVDYMIADDKKHQAASAITIPMLGWIAKDQKSVSFPVSRFGKQQSEQDGAGNGMDKSGKPLTTSPSETSVPFTPSDAAAWVKHLKGQMPDETRLYMVGNEPMLWNTTHRDVHPEPATYEEVTRKYIATAKAIRNEDSKAVIAGPALWGWLATEQSAFDAAGAWSGGKKRVDRKKHGDKPFLEWFLEQVVAEEKKFGKSLIDAIDVHYYPENQLIRDSQKASSEEARVARLRGTKSLWDDAYTDESWIDDKIRMIRRLHDYAKIKPGLGVCIGEYNFYGEKDIGGAIALAEVLGIFARESVACAAYWTYPPEGSPAAAAFKLLRNYDGQGGALASWLVPNNIESTDDSSVLTTYDKEAGTAKFLILNKTVGTPKTFRFEGLSVSGQSKVNQYSLTQTSPDQITTNALPTNEGVSIEAPPLSAHVIVITGLKL